MFITAYVLESHDEAELFLKCLDFTIVINIMGFFHDNHEVLNDLHVSAQRGAVAQFKGLLRELNTPIVHTVREGSQH